MCIWGRRRKTAYPSDNDIQEVANNNNDNNDDDNDNHDSNDNNDVK